MRLECNAGIRRIFKKSSEFEAHTGVLVVEVFLKFLRFRSERDCRVDLEKDAYSGARSKTGLLIALLKE